MIQEAANNSTEQYRQKLISLAPNDDKAQDSVNSYLAAFQKQYDTTQSPINSSPSTTNITLKRKSRACFSSSAHLLDRKSPQKCEDSKEVQLATRNVSGQAARAAWQEFHAQNSDSQAKHPFAGRRRWQQGQNSDGSTQQAQADPQQPDPA